MVDEIVAFSLPKIGEALTSNQDRFDYSADRKKIALSDGAGSSLYPGKWAEILVKSFCQNAENPIEKIQQSEQEWLQPVQEQWRQYYLAKLKSPNRKWWEGGSQIKTCGYATFLGLNLEDHGKKGQWQAIAVGDSCLFKLERKSNKLFVFPIKTAQMFKTTTQCFASLPEYPSSSPQFAEGDYEAGDIFLLATDALSQWLLSDYEHQGEAWKKYFELKQIKDFSAEIARLRQQKLIKNDDITIVAIAIDRENKILSQNNLETLELKNNS